MYVKAIMNIMRALFVEHLFRKCGKGLRVDKGVNIIGANNIILGNDCFLGRNCSLQTWEKYNGNLTGFKPQLIIGDSVSFMPNCQISCMDKVIIGNGVLFGDNVFITDNYHGDVRNIQERNIPPLMRSLYSKGSVKIGNNVWIGRNVCIMPGVKIGDGAIIGANAVVTKDVIPMDVVCGVPAQSIQ